MPTPTRRNDVYTIRAALDDQSRQRYGLGADATVAEVLIYGPIGDGFLFEETVEASAFVRELAALEADRIIVRINSEGGSVPDGIAIHNALKRHPAVIDTENDGMAASIASLIFMAGDNRRMADNSMLMLHAPHSLVIGNARDLRLHADVLDKWADAMTRAFTAAMGDDRATDVQALLTDGADHWYTASEAQSDGFATEITGGVPIAARYDFRHLDTQSIPAAAAAFSKQEGSMPKQHSGRSEHNGQSQHEASSAQSAAAAGSPPTGGAPVSSPEATQANVEAKAQTEAQTEARAQARADIMAAEDERKKSIRTAFKLFLSQHGVAELQDQCIDDMNVSADAARTRLLNKIGEGAEPLGAAQHTGAFETGTDEVEKRRQAKTQALLARMDGVRDDQGRVIAMDGANPYRGMRLAELAKASLREVGVDVSGQHAEEFAPKALAHHVMAAGGQTRSDFPVILEDAMHKLLLNGFQATPITYRDWTRQGQVSDFREWKRLVPGLLGGFDPKSEAGEYKQKNIPDAEMESIRVDEFGNIIIIDRRVLVDDNIGYIQTMAGGLGMAAARGIESSVYKLLASNPNMSDGNKLFSAAHNNLAATGAAPSVDTLVAAADAMAEQKAPGADQEYLDIQPTASVSRHTTKRDIQSIVESRFDPESTGALEAPNKARGLIDTFVGTPRIAGNEWYLFGDSNVAPVIEVAFLNGATEPRLLQAEDFDSGSLKWRPTLDYGVGAIDYRGAFKNPGA